MKNAMVLLMAIIIVVALPAMAAGKADAAAGKTLFATKCAACHGTAGEGKPVMAKALGVEMKALGSKEVQAKSDAQLKKDTVEGVGKMKPVKLGDDDAANVIAFVRTLK